jgi:hypothetical protein
MCHRYCFSPREGCGAYRGAYHQARYNSANRLQEIAPAKTIPTTPYLCLSHGFVNNSK